MEFMILFVVVFMTVGIFGLIDRAPLNPGIFVLFWLMYLTISALVARLIIHLVGAR